MKEFEAAQFDLWINIPSIEQISTLKIRDKIWKKLLIPVYRVNVRDRILNKLQ